MKIVRILLLIATVSSGTYADETSKTAEGFPNNNGVITTSVNEQAKSFTIRWIGIPSQFSELDITMSPSSENWCRPFPAGCYSGSQIMTVQQGDPIRVIYNSGYPPQFAPTSFTFFWNDDWKWSGNFVSGKPAEQGGIGNLEFFYNSSSDNTMWSYLPELIPASAVNITAPTGATTNPPPSYEWHAVSGATWYQLRVRDGSGIRINKWYRSSQLGCNNDSQCSIEVPMYLTSGDVSMWVRAWGRTFRYGNWSSKNTFSVE